MNPESLFIQCPGLKLHVSCWGEPEFPALLLLHGMRDHSRSWDWVAGELASHYRIYAPDLRGHGDSGWVESGAYNVPDYLIDIEDIAGALCLQKFAIVGHSFGGALGLRYASVFPEKVTAFSGIECVELPILRDQRSEPVQHPARLRGWIEAARASRSRQPRDYPSLDEAEKRMYAENLGLSPDTISHLVKHGVIATADGNWRWKYDNAARLRAPDDADGRDIDQMLDALICPVMLAYGTASWVEIPPRDRLARISALSLIEFPGASHWLHHTSRGAYIDALRTFLAPVF